jgi:hypothetical protein
MRGSPAACWASNRSSIVFALRPSTGRDSSRCTFSVVRVFAWPGSAATSATARENGDADTEYGAVPYLAASGKPPGGGDPVDGVERRTKRKAGLLT